MKVYLLRKLGQNNKIVNLVLDVIIQDDYLEIFLAILVNKIKNSDPKYEIVSHLQREIIWLLSNLLCGNNENVNQLLAICEDRLISVFY